ncbi:MAG TPA: hypothetical protein VMS12_02640 [Thermoanaerobaculia bacterium]|nr:hypothetical protein [Thermoanaerobaculia bacterium]
MTKRSSDKPRVSPEFLHALFGIAMTLFSWYSPWAWPAWPALAALNVMDRWGDWTELESNVRAAILVILIVLNVGIWGGASWLLVKFIAPLGPRLFGDRTRS